MTKIFWFLVNTFFGFGWIITGVMSAIWLIAIGEWWYLLFGIVFMFSSSLVIMIVPLPALLFSIPAIMSLEKKQLLLGKTLLFLSNIVSAISISALSILIFWHFTENSSDVNLIPVLMWSYAVAMTPWTSAVGKEQENGDSAIASLISTYFQMSAYIIGAIIFYLGYSLFAVVLVFTVVMALSVILQTYITNRDIAGDLSHIL